VQVVAVVSETLEGVRGHSGNKSNKKHGSNIAKKTNKSEPATCLGTHVVDVFLHFLQSRAELLLTHGGQQFRDLGLA
jgi:hypothetical protein